MIQQHPTHDLLITLSQWFNGLVFSRLKYGKTDYKLYSYIKIKIIRGRITKSFGKLLYIKLAQVQYTWGFDKRKDRKSNLRPLILYYIIQFNNCQTIHILENSVYNVCKSKILIRISAEKL